MVSLDSNIFIIDRFFHNDALYPQNRAFIERLDQMEAAISIFTLLEICGVASFNLSPRELEYWLYEFVEVYPVLVLDPFGLDAAPATEWIEVFLSEVAGNISKKMTLGDAIILREAERYRAEALITWNTKDFLHRAHVPVVTPEVYLRNRF